MVANDPRRPTPHGNHQMVWRQLGPTRDIMHPVSVNTRAFVAVAEIVIVDQMELKLERYMEMVSVMLPVHSST